jgi:hypothetical protein
MDYIIKKGKHYSNWFNFPFFTFRRSIKFHFIIESSAHYTLNNEDDYDWNKLFGLSNAWNSHESSARICWRRLNEEQYQVCLYTYDNGIRNITKEINLYYDTFYGARIIISRNNFYLLFKDSSLILQRRSEKLFPIKTILKPYFGGTTPAPHDIKIKINTL